MLAAFIVLGAALFGVHYALSRTNRTFNEIAIQPRPASVATVSADAMAELAQAVSTGGQLLVTEIAGSTTTAPALDTRLSCPPGTNSLVCDGEVRHARNAASDVIQRLAGNPDPAALDVFAVFQQTAGYLSEQPHSYQAINIWINTTAAQVQPISLAGLSSRTDVAALARRAVHTGAFPHSCRGYAVHMVVPPSGSPQHQRVLRQLFADLISNCGGRLASWTSRWIVPSGVALTLPPIRGASPGNHSYTLSDMLGDFAVGSAALTATARSAIRQIATDIEVRFPGQSVTCTGQTDGTGTAAFDKKLSDARAANVCGYLARLGIPSHLLHPRGTGKAIPAGANPALRRVIISIGRHAAIHSPA
jgi:OmpA family